MRTLDSISTAILRAQGEDGVLWLIKDDAQTNNGLSLAMVEALTRAFESAKCDPDIRAVVVDAVGGFHGPAVLVKELKRTLEDTTVEDFEHVERIGHDLGRLIASLPIAVIGLARAGAMGGGLEMLIRSDFLFCTDTARFKLPEVNFGFVAAWGGTQWGGRLMTYRRAQEFLLLGETMDGVDAAASGLVTRSFANEEALEAHVATLLDRLRLCSPAGFAGTKASLRAVWEQSLTNGLAVEHQAQVVALSSGDFRRGLAAAEVGALHDYVAGAPRAKPGGERP